MGESYLCSLLGREFELAEEDFKDIFQSARPSFLPERNGRLHPKQLAELLHDFALKHPSAPLKLPTVYRLAEDVLAAET
ncbi:MAG: hypothetical protein AAB499_00785 [Patescibacteria group bacterium]